MRVRFLKNTYAWANQRIRVLTRFAHGSDLTIAGFEQSDSTMALYTLTLLDGRKVVGIPQSSFTIVEIERSIT